MAGSGVALPERPLTDDEMAEVKKEVLEWLRDYLCDKIIADRHFDYLRSRKILSREDTEEISCRPSSRKKAGKLLDYLAEHPKGLDALIGSIRREGTQNFLLEKITDAVLKAKNEKLKSLKGLSCSSCMVAVYEQTNNLSRSQSNDSNVFESRKDRETAYLPQGEYNTAAFVSAASLCSMNLPITEVGNTENSVFSATLPGPGDSGAPPLPPQMQNEQEETCPTSSDNPFLPLRSRSLLPQ
ncbi:B-cell lymphoma/leukemia 10 [Anolis carolinensis]|uniref:B-cell lymphoma/leukemia 10 n=1 Tax=Anolis carolinensis TaxID=28377 RepID=H9GJM8_ANOCA|nr:PREDICTED: B-cell lymphoma/leukemia 10 [Anolis carolinensis]|eukprot:XP_003223119.1 PREDICTED: B-cell lymphoma/leukemia 10 [Anolis carolinensis]